MSRGEILAPHSPQSCTSESGEFLCYFLRPYSLAACFSWSSAWILIVDFRVDFHSQIFFALFPSLPTRTRPQNPSQNPSFCHRKTQDKKSATKSVTKSVPLGRKSIVKSVTATRKIRRNSTQLRRAPDIFDGN